MIQSKEDLKYYIKADQISLGCYLVTFKMRVGGILTPSIWKFQIKLRKLEYVHNCKRKNIVSDTIFLFRHKNFERYSIKLGFDIPLNVFGPGLCLCHIGPIIVNECAKVGSNCRVHSGVNIGNLSVFGEKWVPDNTPTIGNNVYIGPGAKLFGKIKVGDNSAIGANAVVNKSVPENVTVAGVPAKVISHGGSASMNLIHGDNRV